MSSPTHITATITLPNGNEIKVPTNWTDITLSQHVGYLKDIEPLFWEGEKSNESLVWVKALAYFTGISDKDLREMKMGDLLQAAQCLHFLVEPLQDFEAFKANFEEQDNNILVIGGQGYSFPESLPSIPMTNLSFGDFYDSMDYWKQGDSLLKGKIEVLPQMMAILVKKEDEEMPIELTSRSEWIESRSKFWESQNMYYGWQLLFFFLQALRDSKNSTLLSLKAED